MVANNQGDGDQDELTLLFVTSINPDTRIAATDVARGSKPAPNHVCV